MGIKKKTLRIGDLVVPSWKAASYTRKTRTLGIIAKIVEPTIVLVYWIADGKTNHYGLSELKRINPRHKQ
tara:strand:- start:674 stop:883 length:210 start_codon:yes stop_codon:yes gene_type:complete